MYPIGEIRNMDLYLQTAPRLQAKQRPQTRFWSRNNVDKFFGTIQSEIWVLFSPESEASPRASTKVVYQKLSQNPSWILEKNTKIQNFIIRIICVQNDVFWLKNTQENVSDT